MAITKLENLINPEVIADFVETKLVDNMVFSPLADIDYTLEGRAGSILKYPVWNYIGSASVLSEASTLSVATLSASTASVEIYKIAKGVRVTDEAILSGLGDAVNEGARQITVALASKIDDDLLNTLASDIASTMTYETSASTVAPADTDITDALELFGEDIDGTKVLLCSPKQYTGFRKSPDWIPASEIAAELVQLGVVGKYMGANIVPTDTVTAGEPVMMLRGALTKEMKRSFLAEKDRILNNGTTSYANLVAGSEHRVYWLNNVANAVKLTVSP
jgi:N4-gp56 family major capsid protein